MVVRRINKQLFSPRFNFSLLCEFDVSRERMRPESSHEQLTAGSTRTITFLIPSVSPTLMMFLNRLMPIMISRLMLSLKKASTVRESGWTSDALSRTHPRVTTPIAFGGRRNCPEDGGRTTFDEVELSDLSDGWVRGRSSSVRAIGPTSDRSQ